MPIRSISSPSRCLSSDRPGVVLGQHALEARVVAFDGDHRLIDQLADGGLLGLGLESRPSGPPSAPRRRLSPGIRRGLRGRPLRPCSATSFACISSKASEMYFRKISPSTTCLYSAASMLLRSLSAASQSFASNPRVAPLPFSAFVFVRAMAIRDVSV